MITVEKIAEKIGGMVRGDQSTQIVGAAPIRDVAIGEVTLADDPKFISKLEGCPAAAAIVCEDFPELNIPTIVVADVHAAFCEVVSFFSPGSSAQLSRNSSDSLYFFFGQDRKEIVPSGPALSLVMMWLLETVAPSTPVL